MSATSSSPGAHLVVRHGGDGFQLFAGVWQRGLKLPRHLRRFRYRDTDTGKTLVFLTSQFALPARTICALYKCRW